MDTKIEIPKIELKHIELLSISCRNASTSRLPLETASSKGEMSLSYRFYSKRKSSFKITFIITILYETVRFRARYRAEFIHREPLPQSTYDSKAFYKEVVDTLLPFNTELFAFISAKIFGRPIIAPCTVSEDTQK